MIKRCIWLGLIGCSVAGNAQKVNLNPTVTPSLFSHNDQITVTYDVTGTSLANLSNAWIWVWIPSNTNIVAKYNINPATAAADPAKFTKTVVGGSTKWSITFKPSDFFTSDISGESQMGVLLKANDWPNGQTTDANPPLNFGFRVSLISPTNFPVVVQVSDAISINATSPVSANFQLYVNNVLTNTQNALLNYSYSYLVPASPDDAVIKIVATQVTGGQTSEVSFQYLINKQSPVAVRPIGIIPGINYGTDPTKVTLCLWAPGKTSAYAFGDFSDWDVKTENLMSKDGDYFWIELSNLTAGQEYGFQYWVEGSLKIAEPFADKILDPEDKNIPAASYPDLKAYPAKAYNPGDQNWYKNRVSVFQTNQTPYAWTVSNFVKPKKESLVIYELLIRDIFDNTHRNYQSLIDTLSYFKKLGINAIELMPIMEFNGNESWGYNPTFMFAPDKFYGTKNKLKEFIDKCHQNGIAVIFDIAINHQDLPNALLMQDFNFTDYKPNATNKWFNVKATHPFNVFYDLNHESPYTKTYLDSVTHYWIDQYKIDGYRFDLSKGFTSVNYCTTNNCDSGPEVSAWSAYDASRISILKRMADKIWAHAPDAYIVLEHLGVDSEEKELADYRANEGKGMMLWGKMTDSYNQNTMGYASGSEITRVYHGTRNFTAPNLVGYMESHDEERLMYKNLQYGNSNAIYNVKELSTALKRMEGASVLFYTIPGPKMLWEFGELGFELSINRCEDGTISNNCRLSIKPPKWDYLEDPNRYKLFAFNANLIKLKKAADVFQNGIATFSSDNLVKAVSIKNKNYTTTPSDSTQMSVVMVANFDITSKNYSLGFPHTGNWYEYFSGSTLSVSGTNETLSLAAGDYKMYTNVKLTSPLITAIKKNDKRSLVQIFPNPVDDYLESNESLENVSLITMTGARLQLPRVSERAWDARYITSGFYIGTGELNGQVIYFKVIKK